MAGLLEGMPLPLAEMRAWRLSDAARLAGRARHSAQISSRSQIGAPRRAARQQAVDRVWRARRLAAVRPRRVLRARGARGRQLRAARRRASGRHRPGGSRSEERVSSGRSVMLRHAHDRRQVAECASACEKERGCTVRKFQLTNTPRQHSDSSAHALSGCTHLTRPISHTQHALLTPFSLSARCLT